MQVFEQKSFQMAAVVLVLANGMIDGVAPSYKVLMDVSTVGPAVLCASYARWMVQVRNPSKCQAADLMPEIPPINDPSLFLMRNSVRRG